MINWIILLFSALGWLIEEFFNLYVMLIVNLPIIAISRFVYMYTYYKKYKPFSKSENDEFRFSRNETLYFSAKNALVILIGFIHIYLALFFSIYSLMCAFIYSKELNKQKEFCLFLILWIIGMGCLYSIPMQLGVIKTIDLMMIIPVIIALHAFIFWGRKYAELSIEGLYERYQKRIYRSIPASLQYTIILFLIVPVLILIIGIYTWQLYFFEWLYYFLEALIDINVILTINLPLLIIANLILFIALYLDYSKTISRDTERISLKSMPKGNKAYLALSHIIISIIGLLVIYVAFFFAMYLLIIAAYRFKRLLNEYKSDVYNFFIGIAICIVPLFLLFFFLNFSIKPLNTDYLGYLWIPLSITLAIVLVLLKSKKSLNLSLKKLLEKYNLKFRKVPPVLKYFTIGYMIIVPTIWVMGVYFSTTPRIDTVYIPTRDGKIQLATDIHYSPQAWNYFTNKPLPAPVVLIRTPYGKAGFSGLYSLLYLPQGYHVVVQDIRGTYDSVADKDFIIFTTAYTDGLDTINWIMDQEWCNGYIGSAGASALCINQYFYAGMAEAYKSDNKGLRAQSLWFGCPDLYLDAIMEGAYHQSSVETWLSGTAPNNWRYQIDYIFDLMRDPAVGLNSNEYLATTLDKGINTFGNVSVRAIHVGGWYDHFLQGTIRGYIGYDDKGTERARGHQKMIIGPWTHGMVIGGRQGDLVYPATSNGLPLLLKWENEIFEESFSQTENPSIWEGNRVAYYLMGDVDDPDVNANYWKYARDWPLPYTENRWYFGNQTDCSLVLVDDPADLNREYNITYTYDPRDPVITAGGNNQPGFDTAGPKDQRGVETDIYTGELRKDVILFQSEVLTQPYTIEGELRAELLIKSDVNDTDYMVKLCDVYPDGRRMLIIDGALMTRFRVNMTSMNLITPGETYNITVNLFATAYQFNIGHRIAVTITSSNYDRYAINPNTGGHLTDHFADSIIANNTIITGPGKSCIVFPELTT